MTKSISPLPAAEGPPPFLRGLAERLAAIVVGRWRTLVGALFLSIAATLMLGAWRAGPRQNESVEALRALTARAPGEIEALWWRLDFDPGPLGKDGTNWLALTAPELCARLRFEPATGGATRATFCRRHPELRTISQILQPDLAPDLPVTYPAMNDAPRLDVRLSRRAADWLAGHPPSGFWVHPDIVFNVLPKLRSELELLAYVVEEEERRIGATPDNGPATAAVEVAYDPHVPHRAVPAALRSERLARAPSEVAFAKVVLVAAVVPWCAGWFFVLWGHRKWIPLAVALATALALPWWGDRAAHMLNSLWRPAGGFVEFFSQTLVPGAPIVTLREPGYQGEPGDLVRPWKK